MIYLCHEVSRAGGEIRKYLERYPCCCCTCVWPEKVDDRVSWRYVWNLVRRLSSRPSLGAICVTDSSGDDLAQCRACING